MDDKFCGLGSEIFTLVVGAEAKELFVQKDILVRIPYFSTALSSGQYVESKKKKFHLPEDDPQAVATVIYCVFTNQVQWLKAGSDTSAGDTRDVRQIHGRGDCQPPSRYIDPLSSTQHGLA